MNTTGTKKGHGEGSNVGIMLGYVKMLGEMSGMDVLTGGVQSWQPSVGSRTLR